MNNKFIYNQFIKFDIKNIIINILKKKSVLS